jgi:hypothetical protein
MNGKTARDKLRDRSLASRRGALLLCTLHEGAFVYQTVRARIHRAVYRHAESEAESVLEPGL